MKYSNLNNKIAIITGASRGIGKAISIKLADNGVKVMLVARNADDLKSVKKSIKLKNGIAEYQATDISKLANSINIIEHTINLWGNIDILINNAGIVCDNLIVRMKENEWDNVINVNLKGCFNGIKAVSRPMIKNKSGRIINITSIIGQIGNKGQCNYAASKAGILGLTKSMAKELGSRNITVNAIAPGYIITDMTEKLTETTTNQIKSSIPLERFGIPDDIAHLVCFLASDQSGYITGQTFNVDGGMVMI